MSADERIRTAFDRSTRALELRPTMGVGTARTTATIRVGLASDVKDGQWQLQGDMSPKVGGEGTAPDPGVYGRAGLATCLAVGYALWAARLDVPIVAIEVTVEADYDVRAEFGMTEAPPGYQSMRYLVSVESDAPEAEVLRVLDRADDRSPWLDNLRRPVEVTRELTINRSGA
jgi:uncharacterized OsmC-like protein